MPDNNRNEQIERAINREVAGALTIRQHGASTFLIAPQSMSEVLEFAKLMAVSGVCIRPTFRGNPGACLAITLQAMKWGADPFAVANKAFEVNGQLSYESQLIHAIVNSSPVLEERLHASYTGEGPQRQCLVVGLIKGEKEAREYLSPKIGDIIPKNSPLWKTDPDQQLFYYSTRSWARRWVPEIMLGIYAPDELTIDHETPPPRPRREDFTGERQERLVALAENVASPDRSPELQQDTEAEVQEAMVEQRPRRQRRTKAEMEAARAAESAAPPNKAAKTYAVVDHDGEIHEFGTPTDVANFLGGLLGEAGRKGRRWVDALWIDNQATMARFETIDPVAFRVLIDAYDFGLELATSPPATTERPLGPDDAPEPDRQGPRAEEASSAPPAGLQSAGVATEPVYNKLGQVDRAWWIALLLPKLRAAKTRQEFDLRLADNGEAIAAYKQTLAPAGLIAAMKEIEDIQKGLS